MCLISREITFTFVLYYITDMKKLITLLTTTLLIQVSLYAINPAKKGNQTGTQKNTSTFSTKSMKATLMYDDSNLLTLELSKTDFEKVKISIVKDGITIFSDSYKSAQTLSKGYDLKELPKGKYIIVITQGANKFEKQIEKILDQEIE